MAISKPEITGMTHMLPFDRLSGDEFERLSLWIVRREGFKNVEHLGASGSEQGRDIIAWRGGEKWAFQCKRVKQFGFKTAEEEIKKVLALPEKDRPAIYVFIASCNISANTREKVRVTYPELETEFWAETELDEKAKRHLDILDEFFTKPGIREKPGRNRENMLQLVRNTWIEEVFKQSLHNKVLIEIDMVVKMDALEHRWAGIVQMPDRKPSLVSPGTKMLDLFNQANGYLLIVGKPGSGKTTMLLELCRQLIKQAEIEKDTVNRIPVVFNLSTWQPEPKEQAHQNFSNWLEQEFHDKYYVSKKISSSWIDSDSLLLLLDGLDEVRKGFREKCVEAINSFRKERSFTPLVVCSRSVEYEALNNRLEFESTITLQPLTPEQINVCLTNAGESLVNVKSMISTDSKLRNLFSTPLMLDILILAYQDLSTSEIQMTKPEDELRNQLFDAFFDRVFTRYVRTQPEQKYSRKKTKRWLIWLAQGMTANNQPIFLIERIQPSWLKQERGNHVFERIYWIIMIPLIIISVFSCLSVFGLSYFDFIPGWIFSTAMVISLIFIFFLFISSWSDWDIKLPETISWSWQGALRKEDLVDGWKLLLGISIVFAIFVMLSLSLNLEGGIGMTFYESIAQWIGDLENKYIIIPVVGFVTFIVTFVGYGLVFGIYRILKSGLETGQVKTTTQPNQGIWLATRNAVIILIISFLIATLGFGLYYYGGSAQYPLASTLISGVFFALLSFLGIGRGTAILQHFILRFIIWRRGLMPWRIVRFLDFTSELIIIQKVGGGYKFMHGLLMDYFADMKYDAQDAEENE